MQDVGGGRVLILGMPQPSAWSERVRPIVLGKGKRLFGGTSDKKPLRLADSKVVGDGVAILVYERAG